MPIISIIGLGNEMYTQTYLMEFEFERDYSHTKQYKIVSAETNLTWRQLQELFDPNYRYNYLKFYYLGGEIKHN